MTMTGGTDANTDRSGISQETLGMLLGVAGVTLFGLTLPATRIAVAHLDPVFIALGRSLLAGALAALVLALARAPWPQRADLLPLAVTAAGVIFGFPLLATIAMRTVPSAHGGIVLGILPLATAAASVILAGERPSKGFWLCGLLGSATVIAFALLTHPGDAFGFEFGDLLLLAAIVAAAIGYAQGAVLARKLGGWQVISWALVLSSPFLLLGIMIGSGPINWGAPWPAWAGFFYVAIFSQFLGFFAWYRGLALGGIARVGQVQLIQPFITLAGAALLVGETLGLLEIGFACAVVVIVAIGRRMRVAR
jgi:drug/metabolite transporter (DMT)-like permease